MLGEGLEWDFSVEMESELGRGREEEGRGDKELKRFEEMGKGWMDYMDSYYHVYSTLNSLQVRLTLPFRFDRLCISFYGFSNTNFETLVFPWYSPVVLFLLWYFLRRYSYQLP